MKLSAKPIVNWCDVNMYSFGNQWVIRAAEPNTLYFQLIDANQAIQGNNQGIGFFSGITPLGTTAGLRHLLGIGAGTTPYGVKVTFPSVDDTKVITAIATQVDAADSSIWSVSLSSSQIPASGNVRFTVTEGTTIRNFIVTNMLSVEYPGNNGCDGPLPDSGTFNFVP